MKRKFAGIYIASAIAFCTTTVVILTSCNKDAATQSHATAVSADNAVTASGNLIAWYTFDGDTKDHSGNNNNVDFSNAASTTGKKGLSNTAYLFNGTSSYMTVPNSPSLNPATGITIAALVKPMGFYQGVCHSNRVLCKGYNDYDNGRYTIGYDDQLYWNFMGCNEPVKEKHEKFYGSYGNGQGTASGVIDSNAAVHPNQWYLLVYTCDGKHSDFYVNGVLQDSAKAPTSFTDNGEPLFIGRNQDPLYPYYFNGIIDEIRIYNKALNIQSVSKLNF